MMKWARLVLPRFLLIAFLLGISFLGSSHRFFPSRAYVLTVASENVPSSKPKISQNSIDLALEFYNIKVPPHASHPQLDLKLEDRATTSQSGWGSPLQVAIGRSAFSSWGLLGSTLAHELEVHCWQSFAWVNILDLLGLQGTNSAERHAYQYEIDQAQRFSLSRQEVSNIASTMNFYYPIK